MTLAFDLPAENHSFMSRADARWKLAALVPAAVLVALVGTLPPALVALGLALLLAVIAELPRAWLIRRLLWSAFLLSLFLVWLLFLPDANGPRYDLGWFTISAAGLERFGVVLYKTLAVVTLMLVVLATSPLHETLKAAQSLRVPSLFVQLALLTFRYVFLLAEEFVRLRTALRVRGFRNRADVHSWRTIGNASGTLLVRGSERAERVSQAMRSRGFDGTFRSLHEFNTRGFDVVLCVTILSAAAGLLAWDLWRR